jgi:glutaredoxin 3
VQHPVGLAEADRAQHHGLRLAGARHRTTVVRGTAEAVCALQERTMSRVRMYTTRWCGYCVRAKALLTDRGIPFEEVYLDDDPAFRQKLFDLTGGWTVPQITIDEQPIGGYTELWRLDREGRLDDLLAA